MAMKSISFRTEVAYVDDLDRLAKAQKRDRTYVLNEAVEQYLALQKHHIDLIHDGLADAEAGHLTPHEDVIALTKTWGSSK
jgi:predicted transcriptional regulator